jgi:hypothetical protein
MNLVTNKTMYMSNYQTVVEAEKLKIDPVINPFPSTMIPSIFRLPFSPHSWPPSSQECAKNNLRHCGCDVATRPLTCKLGGNQEARWATGGVPCKPFPSSVFHS